MIFTLSLYDTLSSVQASRLRPQIVRSFEPACGRLCSGLGLRFDVVLALFDIFNRHEGADDTALHERRHNTVARAPGAC